MIRKQTIQKFIDAAQTDSKVLRPGKVVARSMSTLGALRLLQAQDWRSITEMFNEAMAQAGGAEVTSATLCRLYNLEVKRLILIGATCGRTSVLVTPETAQHFSVPGAFQATPDHTGIASAHYSQSNLARDGPVREDLAPREPSDPPSVRDTLQMHRELNEFKQQAKRRV